MSFVTQDDVFAVAEAFCKDLVATMIPEKTISIAFDQISHHDAMERFGCDKPDLRFGMELMNATDILNTGAISFMADSPCIKCIKLDASHTTEVSRKVVESYEKVAKESGA